MAKLQVLTFDNLDVIKNYIDVNDAKFIKSVAIDGNVLKFYNVVEPVGDTEPVKEITLPDTDISGLLEKLTTTNVGNVIVSKADGTIEDGGVKLTDLATKTDVEDAIDEVDGKIGTLDDLDTTAKTDLVGAINEVKAIADAGGTGSIVSIDTSTTTEGYLKTYTIKQGETEIGKIDIPKDLVVSSGEIVVDPDGQPEGTYIKLTIANQTTPLFINVLDLIDVYTAKSGATQIQLAISDTNEISATIVAGSVGTTELANSSVSTAKIADANVTASKLADDAKALFDATGSAAQALIDAKAYTDEQLGNIEAISSAEIEALFAV